MVVGGGGEREKRGGEKRDEKRDERVTREWNGVDGPLLLLIFFFFSPLALDGFAGLNGGGFLMTLPDASTCRRDVCCCACAAISLALRGDEDPAVGLYEYSGCCDSCVCRCCSPPTRGPCLRVRRGDDVARPEQDLRDEDRLLSCANNLQRRQCASPAPKALVGEPPAELTARHAAAEGQRHLELGPMNQNQNSIRVLA